MIWKIKWDEKALEELLNFDRQIQKQISSFIELRLTPCDQFETLGKKLSGRVFGSYIKFIVNDYKIICDIQKNIKAINILKIKKLEGI